MTLTPFLPAGALLAVEQQEVTDWPARLAWTSGLLVLIAVLLLLMRRGWQSRGRRQADVPPPPQPPEALGSPLLPPVDGTYIASTTAGDWLDRITPHDLGARSRAVLRITPEGLLLTREGACDIFVPVAALRGARLDRALAGTVTEDGGLVVVTWHHGDRTLDTGFRARHVSDHAEVVRVTSGLAEAGAPT